MFVADRNGTIIDVLRVWSGGEVRLELGQRVNELRFNAEDATRLGTELLRAGKELEEYQQRIDSHRQGKGGGEQ